MCGTSGIWPATETRLVGVWLCELVEEGSVKDVACE